MMTLFTQEPSFSIKCLPTTPSKPHRSLLAARLLVVPSPSSLAKAQSDRLNIGLIRRSLKLCCARDIRLELGQISSRTSRAVEGQHIFVCSTRRIPLTWGGVAYAPLFLCCLRCATEPFPGIYLLPVYSTALPSSLFCWYELIGPLKRKDFFSKDVDLWLGVVYSTVLSLCC
ncbi:BnaCnng12860D [Brassica napus]|uniref:BnaCnng12860D protein n=1 Tax=Brassica napus TaxID=3708 RepID=A0A078I625_BRANA|nr:BnaCnng12860D [Brassica napus]